MIADRSSMGGDAVYVACSTLCFSRLDLDEALRTIRELRFTKADLAIHNSGPHLTPAEVADDVTHFAQRLKAGNLPIAAFHLDVGCADSEVARAQLRSVSRLARVTATPILTIPSAAAGSDFDAEVDRLREWIRISASEGVMLTIETHSATLTADPLGAAELCRRVTGLGLTLDPSHYQVGPHGPMNHDALYPFVRHVRLRDTGKAADQFQVRVGQGEIEYGRIISSLERCNYDRALTVDIRDVADSPFAIEPEVRKLKYLLDSLV
ncbi:MAG TPA: sugar phosphate isomerase/epimerase [Gemmata sp.]|nr:sugar phosphate isomerase/epimerase [Gemmata sp.]